MPDIHGVSALPVFNRPAQIGVIAERDGRFEAIPASGHSLGLVNRYRSAADAVYHFSRRQRCVCDGFCDCALRVFDGSQPVGAVYDLKGGYVWEAKQPDGQRPGTSRSQQLAILKLWEADERGTAWNAG